MPLQHDVINQDPQLMELCLEDQKISKQIIELRYKLNEVRHKRLKRSEELGLIPHPKVLPAPKVNG